MICSVHCSTVDLAIILCYLDHTKIPDDDDDDDDDDNDDDACNNDCGCVGCVGLSGKHVSASGVAGPSPGVQRASQ